MEIRKITNVVWEIPKQNGMNVPGKIFASEKLLELMKKDDTLNQLRNVAHLPGIYKNSIVMPDGHQGYGFPIGGVAALDFHEGGISPGGIGFDINCGVRVLSTSLDKQEIYPKIKEILNQMFIDVPAGLGSSNIRVDNTGLDKVLNLGAKFAVEDGYGNENDLKNCEESGSMKQANADYVSGEAKKRGRNQVATLGSGNHFLEIQYVDEIYDPKIAKKFGITEKDQVTVMIHCGSRGLGHQVCTDYIREMEKTYPDITKKLPDRQLIYSPAGSKLAEKYLGAMAAAANFAWHNRHVIGHQVRKSFKKVFGTDELNTIYDVAHNICKIEEHIIDGKKVKVYLHRKGATRAFGPGREEIPSHYRDIGQPIIIPGSMGTASYLLVGTETAMKESFGSTAHGAGRVMSRNEALSKFRGEKIVRELEERNIFVKGASISGIAEEGPDVYKDIDEVVKVSHEAGIGNLVVKLRPIGVIKG